MLRQHSFLITALLSAAALVIALISQHGFAMRPCAWCVFQRLLLIGLIVFGVVGHIAQRRKASNKALVISALARVAVILTAGGGAIAAWYQHSVAAKLFSCDQGFADQFMIGSGLEASLPWLFGIYATCMDATVTILGLPYAVWAIILFALITVISVLPLVNLGPQR